MGVFVAFGIAIGFPWNALISSTTYYEERLDSNSTSLSSMESALTFSYFGMNLLGFLYLHVLSNSGKNARINLSAINRFFAVNLVSFALLALSPAMERIDVYYAVVLVGAMLGVTSALYQHEMFALSARVHGATAEFVFGFAIAGFLASLCSLLTRNAVGADVSAVLNFSLTVLSLAVALALFVWRRPRELVMDQQQQQEEEEDEGEEDGMDSTVIRERPIAEDGYVAEHDGDNESVVSSSSPVVVLVVVDDIRWFLLALGNVMCGTLMVFPAVVAGIKPLDRGNVNKDYSDHSQQFTAILFVLFNAGDLIGRGIAPHTMQWASARMLALLSVLRFGVLFLCFACNRSEPGEPADYDTSRRWEDWAVYGLILGVGVTGGMLFSAAATAAPNSLPDNPSRAGKLVALAVAVSLVVGAVLGSLVVSVM